MNGDPNWFFSALAQSSAAIVGIIGAIFISKIIEHTKYLKELRYRIIDSRNKIEREKHEISIELQKIKIPDQFQELKKLYHELKNSLKVTRFDPKKGYLIGEYWKAKNIAYEIDSKIYNMNDKSLFSYLHSLLLRIIFDFYIEQIKYNKKVSEFYSNRLNITLRSIFIPLGLLIIFGIIYPLSKLDAPSVCDKTLCIIIFSIAMVLLILIMVREFYQSIKIEVTEDSHWDDLE